MGAKHAQEVFAIYESVTVNVETLEDPLPFLFGTLLSQRGQTANEFVKAN